MSTPMDLTNKNILVTGASSGIGRDTAVLLSELGASLIIVARREDELNNTRKMMRGSNHIINVYNLRNIEHIPLWIKELSFNFGPLDGLVHCAGVEIVRPLRLITSDTFTEIMDINVNAAIALTKGFRQKNVYRRGGSIVYISSVAGITGQVGHAEYCASKSALIGICKSLALELAKDGIRVNCIAPGVIQSELFQKAKMTRSSDQIVKIISQQPLGLGTPRDVSNAVAFLLADTGRWITGTTLVVDGGYTAH